MSQNSLRYSWGTTPTPAPPATCLLTLIGVADYVTVIFVRRVCPSQLPKGLLHFGHSSYPSTSSMPPYAAWHAVTAILVFVVFLRLRLSSHKIGIADVVPVLVICRFCPSHARVTKGFSIITPLKPGPPLWGQIPWNFT